MSVSDGLKKKLVEFAMETIEGDEWSSGAVQDVREVFDQMFPKMSAARRSETCAFVGLFLMRLLNSMPENDGFYTDEVKDFASGLVAMFAPAALSFLDESLKEL